MLQRVCVALLCVLVLVAAPALHAQQTDKEKASKPATRKANPKGKDKNDTNQTVDRLVLVVRPAAVMAGSTTHDSLFLSVDRLHLFDETDTLGGFVQGLGQIGKPYQRFQYGLSDHHLRPQLHRDPLTGRHDVYALHLSQLPHYDTRTPFVYLHFDQFTGEFQLLNFHISQNINPFWNSTVNYRRRTGVGAYLSNNTDHYNISFTNYLHSFDNNLQVLFGGSWNQLQDQMNGGIDVTDTVYANLFQKNRSVLRLAAPTTSLTGIVGSSAVLVRWTRMAYVQGSYGIRVGGLQRLTLLAGIEGSEHRRLWRDYTPNVYVTADNFARYRTYGTVYADTLTRYQDEYHTSTLAGMVGARHRFAYRRLTITNQINYHAQRMRATNPMADSLAVEQLQNTLRLTGRVADADTTRNLYAAYTYERSVSKLFAPEQYVGLDVVWQFPRREYDIQDSMPAIVRGRWRYFPMRMRGVYAPVQLQMQLFTHLRNPSLFDTRWHTPTFRPNTNLGNEQVLHWQANMRLTGRPATARSLPYLQNYVALGVFFSSVSQAIYADSAARIHQATVNENYQWQGLNLCFRGRLGRFYLENNLTWQRGSANATGLQPYANHQPNVYGKASIFFRSKMFREGRTILNVQLDANYFAAHNPMGFEPSLQSWYPQYSYKVPAYVRLDAIVSAHIRFASFYVRYLHFNENIGLPGYLTTPFYPMLQRSFNWGFTWYFYD